MNAEAAPPVGIIAEFGAPAPMLEALRAAKAAGWRNLDAYAPYPLPEAAAVLGAHGSPVGWIAVAAAACGAALAFGTEVWLNAIDYPLNVGGRPLFSWPVFLPAAMIVSTLWGAAAALIGMLTLNGLPRLHHPVFAAPGFERATEDRFFLCLFASDPLFEQDGAAAFLGRYGPLRVSEVPPS